MSLNGAVFLSYASGDAAAAERIATTLRAAGIEVWFDQSELRGGDAWDASIRKQIVAVPGDGEAGCLFDEIQNLVGPDEQPVTDDRAGLPSHGWRDVTERPDRRRWHRTS